MIFKNRKAQYNILFSSNLSIANIAKVMGVSESTVLKAKRNILGELANNVDNAQATSLLSSCDINLDDLAKSVTLQAYKLEEERDNFYKKFYAIANSYISSHFKYKELIFQSDFKKLTKLNIKIANLEKEINNSNDEELCRKLRLELQYNLYKRNRIYKKLVLNDMREDYECLMKLKRIFKSKGLKLE